MLGLHTTNGWRAGFAIAVAGTLIGLGSGAAVAAPAVTRAEAQAINATGALVEILDSGDCKTTVPVADPGTGPDQCGEGLDTNAIDAFSQHVSGTNAGVSNAAASIAPINLEDLAQVSLVDVIDAIDPANLNTQTILDDIIDALDPALQPILDALVPTVIGPLDNALNGVLTQLGDALPITLEIGAVHSEAQATAKPKRATGSSGITDPGLVLRLDLGGQDIVVPITLGTAPNTPVLLSVDDIVDGVEQGLEDTLTQSLGGALGPLANVLSTIDDQVIEALMAALQDPLQQLGEAIAPLVQGTVNKQTPVSPTNTGKIEVIGLELILLEGAGQQGTQTLQLARVAVGPNSAGTGTSTPTPPVDEDDDGDGDDGDGDDGDGDDGDGDDGDGPKSVDSGLNDGGNLGALAITGLLAASTLVGSAARQRLLLDR